MSGTFFRTARVRTFFAQRVAVPGVPSIDQAGEPVFARPHGRAALWRSSSELPKPSARYTIPAFG